MGLLLLGVIRYPPRPFLLKVIIPFPQQAVKSQGTLIYVEVVEQNIVLLVPYLIFNMIELLFRIAMLVTGSTM